MRKAVHIIHGVSEWVKTTLQVMKDARARAEHEPLRLSSNWLAAGAFFLVWLALSLTVVNALCDATIWGRAHRSGVLLCMGALIALAFGWAVREALNAERERAQRPSPK